MEELIFLHDFINIILTFITTFVGFIPVAFIPIIVIIETVMNIIRPGILSIRLAANIIGGQDQENRNKLVKVMYRISISI